MPWLVSPLTYVITLRNSGYQYFFVHFLLPIEYQRAGTGRDRSSQKEPKKCAPNPRLTGLAGLNRPHAMLQYRKLASEQGTKFSLIQFTKTVVILIPGDTRFPPASFSLFDLFTH